MVIWFIILHPRTVCILCRIDIVWQTYANIFQAFKLILWCCIYLVHFIYCYQSWFFSCLYLLYLHVQGLHLPPIDLYRLRIVCDIHQQIFIVLKPGSSGRCVVRSIVANKSYATNSGHRHKYFFLLHPCCILHLPNAYASSTCALQRLLLLSWCAIRHHPSDTICCLAQITCKIFFTLVHPTSFPPLYRTFPSMFSNLRFLSIPFTILALFLST